ncbi:hypothetical protein DFQ26_001238 [Actinomortierella ambigua]|nr:hypothetical protein DFQ26_001238 [Actinomortierella ambigua]
MSNPLFDDFLELDMLDMSTSPSSGSDMYPFLFSTGTELDSTLDPVTAAAMSLLDDPLATGSPLSLDIDVDQQEESQQQQPEQQPQQPHEQQQQQQQPSPEEKEDGEAKLDPSLLAIATAAAASLGTNINPSQLLLTPPAEPLTMSPTTATTSLFASATSPTASNTKPDSSAVRSAKRARSNSLEPSAELIQAVAASTKAPLTAAASKTSSASSRKSSTSSPSSTAPSAKNTTATSTSSTSAEENDTASLTSTTNTTLSAATLQFLLQQQAQAPLVPQLFSGTLTREEIDATLAQLLESTKHLLQPDTPLTPPTPGGAGGAATSSSSSSDSPLAKIKEEMSEDEGDFMEGLELGQQPSMHGLKTQPGIKTDDIPSPTDLKKMTSKERRQLRNKISARNFRVRRKEYISTLEGQVHQHKTEARHLREAVTLVQDENLRLKKELEEVKRQLAETTISNAANALSVAAAAAAVVAANTTATTTTACSSVTATTAATTTAATAAETTATPSSNSTSTVSPSDEMPNSNSNTTTTTPATTTITAAATTATTTTNTDAASTVIVSPTPLSKENQSLLSAIMSKGVSNALHPNAKANITLSLARPQSPILLPNYHKDVPNSTSAAAAAGQGSSWKDKNPILVHRTLIPEVYFADGFELSDKPPSSMAEDRASRPWMQLCQEEVEEKGEQEDEKEEKEEEKAVSVNQEQQQQQARVQSETAPHLDGMAVLYEVMQTCAWTMWMGSTTMGDYDGSLWLLPEEEEDEEATTTTAVDEEQQEQVEDQAEEEARALAMSYEDSDMLEWLYESLMARLVEMDLQQTQQQAGDSAAVMV